MPFKSDHCISSSLMLFIYDFYFQMATPSVSSRQIEQIKEHHKEKHSGETLQGIYWLHPLLVLVILRPVTVLCSKYKLSLLHKALLFFFPPTCLSFTHPLFPRVFSGAIFNLWKDECRMHRKGKNGFTVLESPFLNAVTSSEYVNAG